MLKPGQAPVIAKTLLGATMLVAAFPGMGRAQQITGLYIGGGLGYNILQDVTGSVDKLPGRSSPPLPLSQPTTIGFTGGFAGTGAIGFGVGNGVRLEVEGSYRSNAQSATGKNAAPVLTNSNQGNQSSNNAATSSAPAATGSENKYGVMVNVLYDFSVGQRWIFPYVGGGFGYQFVNWQKIAVASNNLDYGSLPTTVTPSGTIGQVAYQGIAGASFPITYVPGLAITAEYRFLGLAGTRNYSGTGFTQFISTQNPNNQTKVRATNDSNHTFLLGFRYAFDPNGPGDTVAPSGLPYPSTVAPAPAPAQQASRMYLIFFDFDRADLTPRARDIVAEAVRNSARIQHTRIEVSGHADRSGDEPYNQRLSAARAEAVAAEMGRWGVPRSVMDIHAYGDTRPLVPTAAGQREPQNRRVEIVYR